MKFPELNERQSEGVLTVEGPLLVIAGAGSGKTKMLTSRIAHLIQDYNVNPANILAVTFTNKAAGEMRHRVGKTLGFSEESWKNPPPFWMENSFSGQPTIGTFHSICVRILRKEMAHLPFTGQFQILDDSDQLSLVKNCFKQLNLNEKMFSPKSFQHSINEAKCACQDPQDIDVADFDLYTLNFVKIYTLYQQEMYKSNGVDFGEIITLTYKLLRDNPDVLQKYRDMYRYIHVDEYQDTNRSQYLIIKLLAGGHRNLCVVGDEDQSIYKWRGADIRNILDFEKDYPDAKIVKLEQNYRSTQTIINASSQVIAHNTTRKDKTLWTANPEGELIKRVQLNDDHQEADFVVKTLKSLCPDRYAYSDVSIFYRTNAQSRLFEDVLRREKVPYNIIGGLKFYDRKEIKDVQAYFRVLANDSDSISMKRIINVPQRGIGKTTVDKIEALQFQREITFSLAAKEAITSSVLTGAAAKKVGEFLRLLDELRHLMLTKNLSEFYHELLDRTGYVQELRMEGTEESMSRVENLQEFDSILVDFENSQRRNPVDGVIPDLTAHHLLNPFLESITLASEATTEDNTGTGVVSLMTFHTSKGLEFPLVFMVGMEEGLFPSIRKMEEADEADVEEERRLCYVGMTRAKETLYMTHAICRRVYGNINYHEPSRFFQEIPVKFLEYQDMSRLRSSGASRFQDDRSTSQDYDDFNQQPAFGTTTGFSHQPISVSGGKIQTNVGRRVRHSTYGEGVIRSQEGSSQDAKITIEFAGRVTKKFILKFVQLEFLN